MIRKKRGLGAGKINAPGGRLEPGETTQAAAIRETEEEVGIIPINPVEIGQLFFIFTNGYSLHGTIFKTRQFSGRVRETEEAIPYWIPDYALPWDEMWADDQLWVPHLLADRPFRGYFIFREDTMLSQQVFTAAAPPATAGCGPGPTLFPVHLRFRDTTG